MAKKKTPKRQRAFGYNVAGQLSFVAAIILAFLLAIGFSGPAQVSIVTILFLLGIVVGILNVSVPETQLFLHAGVIVSITAYIGIESGILGLITPALTNVLVGILLFVLPATLIVALRTTFALAKE